MSSLDEVAELLRNLMSTCDKMLEQLKKLASQNSEPDWKSDYLAYRNRPPLTRQNGLYRVPCYDDPPLERFSETSIEE